MTSPGHFDEAVSPPTSVLASQQDDDASNTDRSAPRARRGPGDFPGSGFFCRNDPAREIAQVYAWAAEEVDRVAYLPTAERFGRILQRAWCDRYAGFDDWAGLRDAIRPFAMEKYKKNGITYVRHAPPPDVDRQLLAAYRKGGYVYQAPYGLFAEHYGRMIQFSLTMHRLTSNPRWSLLAKEAADEAIRDLWRGKLFVGHAGKKTYENIDQIGFLLYGLLQLDATLTGRTVPVEPFF